MEKIESDGWQNAEKIEKREDRSEHSIKMRGGIGAMDNLGQERE